jgi:hypothetical protein
VSHPLDTSGLLTAEYRHRDTAPLGPGDGVRVMEVQRADLVPAGEKLHGAIGQYAVDVEDDQPDR